MDKSKNYSIAEARHSLAALIHKLEHGRRIQLTRRGKPVAVLLSQREFERLPFPRSPFWGAYSAFRAASDVAGLDIDPRVFQVARDRSPGRGVKW
jgi:prevent-host-death family protein